MPRKSRTQNRQPKIEKNDELQEWQVGTILTTGAATFFSGAGRMSIAVPSALLGKDTFANAVSSSLLSAGSGLLGGLSLSLAAFSFKYLAGDKSNLSLEAMLLCSVLGATAITGAVTGELNPALMELVASGIGVAEAISYLLLSSDDDDFNDGIITRPGN